MSRRPAEGVHQRRGCARAGRRSAGRNDLALEGVEAARRTGAERGVGAHLKGNVAVRLVKLGRLEEAAALVDDALRPRPRAQTRRACTRPRPRSPPSVATAPARTRAGEGASRGVGGRGRHVGPRGGGGRRAASLWRDNAGQAFAIVSRALEQIEGPEYALYSAPLYALGAPAQADLALRARALG